MKPPRRSDLSPALLRASARPRKSPIQNLESDCSAALPLASGAWSALLDSTSQSCAETRSPPSKQSSAFRFDSPLPRFLPDLPESSTMVLLYAPERILWNQSNCINGYCTCLIMSISPSPISLCSKGRSAPSLRLSPPHSFHSRIDPSLQPAGYTPRPALCAPLLDRYVRHTTESLLDFSARPCPSGRYL